MNKNSLIKIHNALFEIPTTYRDDMRVPARVFINDRMLDDILEDSSLDQLVNTSTLPGIVSHALAMPDIHQGYGFPIGGVVGLDIHNGGVISPGGIGYDINCGVRLLSIGMTHSELKPYLDKIATTLFNTVPSGVGRGGSIKLSHAELDKILSHGAERMLHMGFGIEDDLIHCEEQGRMSSADAGMISDRAKNRGIDQLGTLGSGNHFLEIQKIAEIYDPQTAAAFGLAPEMVTVMIHCGSRGLGHQTCTDHVKTMIPKLDKWGIVLPDLELACAPFKSAEGQEYFAAMAAAANFAWANRHTIGSRVREAFKNIIGDAVKVKTVYDISHNIGKLEKHMINGKLRDLIIHRKGSTRAFPTGRPEVPPTYQMTGHPVFIPGTMGTSSYIAVGTERGMTESFGSCCHGAGRKLSRNKAKQAIDGRLLREQLEAKGILLKSDSDIGLREEAPLAYKDIDNVISVVEHAHLAKKVARLVPIAVIKGN